MTHGNDWRRLDLETRASEVLDAAKQEGPQMIDDVDGRFELVFVPRKQTLEQLFSKPGPIPDDEA
tara:strand:- start:13695 stop:13889 length:195 start_codon:yes stop_codon:yes gene_type:complete